MGRPKNGTFHQWSDEEVNFLREFYPGHSRKETQKAFNERFNLNLTLCSISGKCKTLHIHCGHLGRFEKGCVSWNKGKKMSQEQYLKCRPTMFTKGNVPSNRKEIGSTRISRDGYIEIKIQEPNKWELLHRLVMQSVLSRKLEKGEMIRFADCNKLNCDPDNLILTTKEINLRVNNRNVVPAKMIRECIAVETLKSEIRKKEKHG